MDTIFPLPLIAVLTGPLVLGACGDASSGDAGTTGDPTGTTSDTTDTTGAPTADESSGEGPAPTDTGTDTDPPDEGIGLPLPTGPYPVGTHARRLTDPDRGEPATPDPDDSRSIVVQLWYPVDDAASGDGGPWLEPAVADAFAAGSGLPPGWAASVHHHATVDATIREGGVYPVLVASHGLGTPRTMYSAIFEDLASHGYVVASVEHPHDTVLTVFPDDGSVAAFDSEAAMLQAAQPASPTPEEGLAMLAALDPYIALWVDDLSFAADELERLHEGDDQGLLTGHLDLDRLGALGHSLGGAASAEVCWLDERFDAGIDMDGAFVGPTRLDGGRIMDKPFLTMLAYDHPDWDESPGELFAAQTGPAYQMTIASLTHSGFGDLAYVMRVLFGDMTFFDDLFGPLDGERALEIERAYTRAFFDVHLRELDAPLLDGPSPEFPEVTLQIK